MNMFIKDYADFIDMVDVHLRAMSTYALTGDSSGLDKAEARLDHLYSTYPEYYKRMRDNSYYVAECLGCKDAICDTCKPL